MGMHIGLVAAQSSVPELRTAFFRTWTKYKLVAAADSLRDAKTMWKWKERNEKFVSAADWTKSNPGKEVYVFWQDGPWATMSDESYVLAADEDGLRKLSTLVGTVLSFVVETAGGCAFFWCFKNDRLRRKIINNDTEVSTKGKPMSEEAGIDFSNFYMDETEALWRAFALSAYSQIPTSVGCQAICVTDRTDDRKR